MWFQSIRNLLVFFFIADYDGIDVKLDGLADEQVGTVVGGKQLHFKKVPVLAYDIQCLSSDGSGRSQYRNSSLFHLLEFNVEGRVNCLPLVPEFEVQVRPCADVSGVADQSYRRPSCDFVSHLLEKLLVVLVY